MASVFRVGRASWKGLASTALAVSGVAGAGAIARQRYSEARTPEAVSSPPTHLRSVIPSPALVSVAEADAATDADVLVPGKRAEGLPTFTRADISLRNGKISGVKDSRGETVNSQVWVTYGEGVYDITEFIESHPGGDHILLAAGGRIEPFWDLYAQHKEEFVYELLEEMRIGNVICTEDKNTMDTSNEGIGKTVKDPFQNDPERHPALVVRSTKPFNAEPPPSLLVASQLTPNDLFYVRNHLPVPKINADEYRLQICGLNGEKVAEFSLDDLKTKFPKHSVAATMQCAGNRRDEMTAVKPVKGGSWELGAISNAEWTGVRLSDVLCECGLDTRKEVEAKHVVFEGLDSDALTKQTYGASIPIDVLERVPDVLLAYEMNGEELPLDHGYPIRVIAPGIVGARNVKWLGRVMLSQEESTSHWQRRDYKGFCPSVDWDTVDFSTAPAIQELPVISAICSCTPSQNVPNALHVEGYAWSGDGKAIVRVDVSADGGRTWTAATLRRKLEDSEIEHTDSPRNRTYDWTRWYIDIPTSTDHAEVVCKAVDSAYNTQPERVESIWNLRGVLNNAWHRVPAPSTQVRRS